MALPSNLSDIYTQIRDKFRAAGIESADLDARLLIQRRTGLEWADLIARPDTVIGAESLGGLESDISRRLAGEPVSRIFGMRSFWGLDFAISPAVLDPRPDTETLVEAALDKLENRPPESILDLGAGSGCILLTLLHAWPQAWGLAVDKSVDALCIARGNAESLGVAARAAFLCGSWAEALDARFDLVVSNPPYIRRAAISGLESAVRAYDPILALDGGADGLAAYKDIFSVLPGLLKQDGIAFFETGFDQAADVMRLAEESGLSVIDVHPDMAGCPRVVEISRGDK